MNQEIERLERQLIDKDRKSIRIHLLYWAIVFLLLAVFLVLIAPGCVNPKAFESFSFASTIVSIVLAVISIIYSFRIGKSSGDNMAGIREIERSIDSKLERFDTLKDQILEGVQSITRPIGEEVGRLHEDQIGLRQEMTNMMSGFSEVHSVNLPDGKEESSSVKIGRTAFYGNLAMYISLLSKKNDKSFSLQRFGVQISEDYVWGFMEASSAVLSEAFSYSVSDGIFSILSFDEKVLGNEEFWRERIMSFSDKNEAESYLKAVDTYFDSNSTMNDIRSGKE